MNLQQTLENIETWTIEEQHALLRGLWHRLHGEVLVEDIDDDLMMELEARMERHRQNPTDTYSWEEVNASLKSRHQQ